MFSVKAGASTVGWDDLVRCNRMEQMLPMEMTARAIEAAKTVLGREIVLQVDGDFTPPGKRTVRVVHYRMNGRRAAPHIRWYVGGKAYRSLPLTNESIALSSEWSSPLAVGGRVERPCMDA